ncbi:MAG: succinate dehydrogenase, cytochrome b556 subunit [Anaerolineae bacterium]
MTTLRAPRSNRVSNVLTYRGGAGHWSWLLHRLTGLGVVLFLALHVVNIWLVGLGRETFERFLFVYRTPAARFLEVFLIFAVLFHALSGARVLLVDLVPGMARRQRTLVIVGVVIVLVLMVPAAWATLDGLFR